MCKIVDICLRIHEANVRRIAMGVLDAVGSRPNDNDLVEAVQYRIPELTNWFMVIFLIRRCFPSPTLVKVQNPTVIQNIVIEAIVIEGLSKYASKESAR